jgi:hypothetical protein
MRRCQNAMDRPGNALSTAKIVLANSCYQCYTDGLASGHTPHPESRMGMECRLSCVKETHSIYIPRCVDLYTPTDGHLES